MYSQQRLHCVLQDISKKSASYETPQKLAKPLDCHGAKPQAVCVSRPRRAQTQELTTAKAVSMLVRLIET